MTILQSDWTGDQEVSIGGWQRHISGDSLADDIRRQWSLRRSLGYETHSHQGPFPQSAAYKSAWRKSQSGETQSAPHQPVYVTPFVRTNECISRAEDAGTAHVKIRFSDALRRVFPTMVASYLPFRGRICQETSCDRSSVTFDLRQCAGRTNCRLSPPLGDAIYLSYTFPDLLALRPGVYP